MAQNIDQSEVKRDDEIREKIKKMKDDLSLTRFTSKNKVVASVEDEAFSDIFTDDFAFIKKEIEKDDITLAQFKYNKSKK